VATPICTYTEYCTNGQSIPGKVVECETNQQTTALVAEIAARWGLPEFACHPIVPMDTVADFEP
jgi:hypothetical protein